MAHSAAMSSTHPDADRNDDRRTLHQLSRINDKLDAIYTDHGAKLDRIVEGQDRIVELLEEQVELMKGQGTKSEGWRGGTLA